jgi:hypothetical protein
VRENEVLDRENVSVQEQQARLARSQLNQGETTSSTDGGRGTRAHRVKTTSRLGHKRLLARERMTGLTRSQSDHCQKSAETDGGFGTHAQWPAAADEVQDRLAGSTLFYILDLQSGYWQLPVHKIELGAILEQNGSIIAYASRSLNAAECC